MSDGMQSFIAGIIAAALTFLVFGHALTRTASEINHYRLHTETPE